MAPRTKILLAFLVLAIATLHAQDKPKAPLTNEDVVAMVNGGLDEGLILQPMTSTSTSLLADCSG